MISKFLLERMIDMVPIASDDPTRHSIMGVLIESKAGNVRLTATNGHMLMSREFEAKCPDGKYMLYKDAVKALKLVLKECKGQEELECAIDSTGGLLVGALTRGHIEKYASEYPQWEQIVPKHIKPVAITLNAEYLLELAKVLTDGEKRMAPSLRIVFDPANPTNAVLIEREGAENFTAVIMPIRDKGTSDYAEAHKPKREEKVSA